MSRADALWKHLNMLVLSLEERTPEIITYHELDKAVPAEAPTPEIMDGLVQKGLVLLLKQKLDADPGVNTRFKAQTPVTLWNQLLTGARIKELSKARIVKKGGRRQLRYDVGDLARTFYGAQLLASAGLQRQRVLDKDELARLQAACAKVKLTLPESVEPTTTERFFADESEGAKAVS